MSTLTTAEVAKRLRVSLQTVPEYSRKGRIKAVSRGLYDEESVTKYLANRRAMRGSGMLNVQILEELDRSWKTRGRSYSINDMALHLQRSTSVISYVLKRLVTRKLVVSRFGLYYPTKLYAILSAAVAKYYEPK